MKWIILSLLIINILIVLGNLIKLGKKCFEDGLLEDYVAGKLSDEQVKTIAKHVSTCESCRVQIKKIGKSATIEDHLIDNN